MGADYLGMDVATFGRIVSCAYVTATNGIASLTFSARLGYRHHLPGIYWSYSGTPTSGNLVTTGLEGDELDMDITSGGPGPMMTPPLVGARGGTVTVALAAGGPGVIGKLTVFYFTIPG